MRRDVLVLFIAAVVLLAGVPFSLELLGDEMKAGADAVDAIPPWLFWPIAAILFVLMLCRWHRRRLTKRAGRALQVPLSKLLGRCVVVLMHPYVSDEAITGTLQSHSSLGDPDPAVVVEQAGEPARRVQLYDVVRIIARTAEDVPSREETGAERRRWRGDMPPASVAEWWEPRRALEDDDP